MDFSSPLRLPTWRGGGDDAFVVDDETGISLMRDQDAFMPLYDVLTSRTSPCSKGKGHETLPLFAPTLLKQRHAIKRSKIPTLGGNKIPSARRNNSHQSRTVTIKQQLLGTMIPSRRSSIATPSAAKRLARSNSAKSLKSKCSKFPQLRTPPAPRTPTPTKKTSPSSAGSSSYYSPTRPRPSRMLSPELEDELRVLVFDVGDGHFNGEPTLVVGNPDTNCHAVFWAKPDRTEFVFHHGRMKEKADPTSTLETTNYDKRCGCMVRGEPETSTFDIPQRLDEYRIELIMGIGRGGIKMEPKLAAMVVMKLFLGMEVPEVLRM